jgi:hypothetical protein
LEVEFFYGPNKIPFFMDEQEMHFSDSAIPLHGIISRGLLRKFEEERIHSNAWHKYAHLIGQAPDVNQEPDLTLLQEYAARCDVLSFSNSAASVRSYVQQYINVNEKNETLVCGLWNIKEGHTSSVWKVNLMNKHHLVKDQFIVNVARDEEAGLELKRTSEKMQTITANFPKINMAMVYDIDKVTLNYLDKCINVV